MNRIIPDDIQPGNCFGDAVAIDGNVAMVGSTQNASDSLNLNPLTRAGAVYVYERNSDGVWSEIQKIVPSDRREHQLFGNSISIDGDYAIIGCAKDWLDSAESDSLFQAGSAYVFKKDSSGIWHQVQKLVAPNRSCHILFGHSISISGNYAVVSAYADSTDENNENPLYLAGSAYVFEKDGSGIWHQVQKLVGTNRIAERRFGISVDISDNFIAVGADFYGRDIDSVDQGRVYLFERDVTGTWTQKAFLSPPGQLHPELFGQSVSIYLDEVLIGSVSSTDVNDQDSVLYAGAFYSFYRDDGGIWNLHQKVTATSRRESERFGYQVDLNENYAISGVPWRALDPSGSNPLDSAGAIDIFKKNENNEWVFAQSIVPNDREVDDWFGYNLALSGGYICAGINRRDSYSGAAYLFESCVAAVVSFDEYICNGDSLFAQNEYQKETGIYYDTLTGIHGCDSIILTNLTVWPDYYINEQHEICDGEVYSWHGDDLTESGIYYSNYTTINGCDSIYELSLTVNPLPIVIASSSRTILCEGESLVLTASGEADSYSWNNGVEDSIEFIPDVGITEYVLTGYFNQTGCSASDTVTLTVNPSYYIHESHSMCEGEVYSWHGYELTESRKYYTKKKTINGCDSVYILNLTVNPLPIVIASSTKTISCEGEFVVLTASGDADLYSWNNGVEDGEKFISTVERTEYVVTGYDNQTGCSASDTVTLIVNPSYNYQENHSICEDEVYSWHGDDLTESGRYYSLYTTMNGCDSIYRLTLEVLDRPGNFSIIGNSNVLPTQFEIYFVPMNNQVNYSWEAINGNTISIPTSNSAEVQWYNLESGQVRAVAINNDNCSSDTAILDVTIIGSLHVDSEFSDKIGFYPNPTSDFFHIKVNIPNNVYLNLSILDITGRVRKLIDINSNTPTKIDCSDLGAGIYLIKLKEFEQFQGKLVVE